MKRFAIFLVLIPFLQMGCLPMPGSGESKPAETKVSPKTEQAVQSEGRPAQAEAAVVLQPSKERTMAELSQNLKSSDPLKRSHALMSLAYFQAPGSVDLMKEALRDRNPGVQKAAILALAEMRETSAVPLFYMLYGRIDNPEIHEAILTALGKVQDSRTIEFLEKMLPRMNPQEAALAYETLNAIRPPRTFTGGSGRVDLDSFTISGVMGKGSQARIQVEREFFGVGDTLLGFKIQSVDPVAGIVKLEKDGRIYSKEIDTFEADPAEKAVEKLNSQDDEEVFQALMDITYYQSVTPASELVALISGSNSNQIRAAAMKAAGQLGIVEAIEPLRQVLEREKDSLILQIGAVTLAMLGDENALDVLEPLSQSQNPWVRNAMASALGLMASQHGIATLVRLLGDSHSFVRNNASEQLMLLAPVGFRNQILSMISSTYTGTVSPEVRSLMGNLIPYLQSIPTGENENTFQLSTTTVSAGAEVSPPPPVYTPQFVLVSLGQFGTKAMANVKVGGETLTIYQGEKLDGLEVVRIAPEDEFLYLKLPDSRYAVVEISDDEETLATVYEIVDAL